MSDKNHTVRAAPGQVICENCGRPRPSLSKRFCSVECKVFWHNHNRTLTANVEIVCEVCGQKKSVWISPSRLRSSSSIARFCSRTCAGKWRRRDNHPAWNGGKQTDKDGYVLVHYPDHPFCNKSGYVRRHRLKMEKKIGRYLRPEEIVHHKNDTPGDDRISNLKLYPNNSAHKADDAKRRLRDSLGRLLPKARRHAA